MGNKDYIKKELEQFLKDIKFWRGIALRIVGGFMFILLGNLGYSYLFPNTILDEMMKWIVNSKLDNIFKGIVLILNRSLITQR